MYSCVCTYVARYIYFYCNVLIHLKGIGMTAECPDEIQQLPMNSDSLHKSSNCWILDGQSVYHHGREIKVQFDTQQLIAGNKIGACIHKDGNLHYYVNGVDRGICWDDKLPTNQAMYGVVDLWGRHKKIKSLFHYGKYTSVLT